MRTDATHADTLTRLHAAGLNWVEIARVIGCHTTTARAIGKRLGLTISKSEGRKRAWNTLSEDAKAERRAQLLAARKAPRAGGMTPEQRDDYRTFLRAGYSAAEAKAELGLTS